MLLTLNDVVNPEDGSSTGSQVATFGSSLMQQYVIEPRLDKSVSVWKSMT